MEQQNTNVHQNHLLTSIEEETIDFKKWIGKIIVNWYFFAIACFIGLSVAYVFNKSILPVSKIRSTVIVESETTSQSAMTQMFLGSNLMMGGGNYYNSLVILQSFSLVEKAVERLDLTVDYKKKTFFKEIPYYKNAPIIVTFGEVNPLVGNISFTFDELDDNSFHIFTEGVETNNVPSFEGDFKYGQTITTPFYSFQIEKSPYHPDKLPQTDEEVDDEDLSVVFTYRSKMSLMKEFSGRLEVSDMVEDGGSVILLTMTSNNPARDIDFTNVLLDEFVLHNLNRKNEQAVKTIDFIQNQLANIADSLLITENALEKFRKENRVMDISAQASTLIDRVNELEQEKAMLKVKSDYYNYLKEYLEKGDDNTLISPTTMGIEDPNVAKLVAELGEFQRKKIDYPEGTPTFKILENKIGSIKKILLETTKNIIANSEMAMKNINERTALVEQEAKTLPATERKLIGIQRKFKVNDAYYTFLLEKLSEAQVTKASNTSDNVILDRPMVTERVNANKKKINYAIGLMLGLLVPFVFLVLGDVLDVRVHTKKDIERITKKPLIGMIPRTKKEARVVTYKYIKSGFTEGFRSIRTRIEFMAPSTKSVAVMVTSSLPGEGKSFISINMAGVFGLSGKKTVLVGFDLRKPKATSYLGVHAEKGLSNYLADKVELKNIIIRPEAANFDFIPSGTIPPNPGELMTSTKMKDLFDYLRASYDVIIVDTPPTGVVADGLWISPYVDLNLFVIRHKYTDKNLLKEVLENAENNNIKNIALLVNDVIKEKERIPFIGKAILGGKYGYSYNYGYGYNYGYVDGGYVED